MKMQSLAALTAAITISASSAYAIGVPSYDDFGPFADPTFGGSGINGPSLNIATTEITDGANTITLGLAATRRYSENPEVTDDGAGTYFATPGESAPASSPSPDPAARWNFNYYFDISGGGEITDYDFLLSYDSNPASSIVPSGVGSLTGAMMSFIQGTTTAAGVTTPGTTTVQGSQNLTFGFLYTSFPGAVAAPTDSFDAFAAGLYSFELSVFASGGTTALGSTAINVAVAPVPLPAGLPLLMVGLGGFAVLRRRKKA